MPAMKSWQLVSFAVWVSSALCLGACGKSDPAPAEKPAKVEAPAPAEPPKASGDATPQFPAADDLAARKEKSLKRIEERQAKIEAACGDLINKSWAAASVAVARVGVEVTPELEAEFRQYPPLLADCARLVAKDRDCLLAGDNPLARLTVCKVRLSTLDFGQHAPDHDRTLSDVDKAELQKWLEGSWVNKRPDNREVRWTIGPEGKVTASATLKDGAPVPTAPAPASIGVEREGEIVVRWPSGDTSQTMTFLRDGADAFYAANRRLRVQVVDDPEHFVLRDQGRWVRYDAGTCEVVLDVGARLDGACTFAKEDGLDLFKVESQVEGARNPTNSAFVVQGKRFMPRAIYDAGRFERQKGGSQ